MKKETLRTGAGTGGFTQRELRILRSISEEQIEKMKGVRFWRNLDFLLYLLVVVVAAFAVRGFLFEPIRVDGDSMALTLLDGEHMFVEKMSYWRGEPARGDIIICYYPGYTECCVKRVVGLPGEMVSVQGGLLYVNGAPLDERDYWQGEIAGDVPPVTVGAREVFVVGDNRNGSKDSRNPAVGCIPYSKIVGKAWAVIWPVEKIRTFPEVSYG